MPVSFSGILPLYPVTDIVYFPKTLVPIRFVEPRYLAMLDDVIAGEELIGILYAARNYDGTARVSNIGTIGRVANVEHQENGETHVILAGVDRFITIGEFRTGYYLTSRAKFLPEALPSPDDPIIFAQIHRLIELIRESKLFEVEDYELPDNARALLFQYHSLINAFCSVSNNPLDTKQKWLETTSVSERYELAVPSLIELIASGQILEVLRKFSPDPDKIGLN